MFSRFISHSVSFFLLLIAFTISLPGHAESLTDRAEYQQISGLIREPLTLSVTLNNGQPAILDAFVTRPVSKRPLPIVLITNGTIGTAEFDRWTLNQNLLFIRYTVTSCNASYVKFSVAVTRLINHSRIPINQI